ncbi:hypothetical protein ACQZ44_12570 [Agrobacterium vitis]
MLAQAQFDKVFTTGVSVMRDIGSDSEFLALRKENLRANNGATIQQYSAVQVNSVRDIEFTEGVRTFCVYDQVTPSSIEGEPPLTAHAGIFLNDLAQSVKNATDTNRKRAIELFWLFDENLRSANLFRGGLLVD